MEVNDELEIDIENKYANKVVFTLEESIYILKQKFFCDEVEDMALDRLIKYIKEESIPKAVVEEKLKSRIASVDKCYKKEIEPYQTEYGLNITLLNKREKEELINKRNCLLVQKHCYEKILEEILNKGE